MLRKALMLYSANGLGFIVNILSIPVLIHLVGFEGYGVYAIYISLSTILLLVATAFSKALVGKTLAEANQVKKLSVLANGMTVYMAQAVLLLVLSPLFAFIGSLIFPLKIDGTNLGFWVSLVAVLEYVLALPGQFLQTLNVTENKHNLYARYQLIILLSRFLAVVLIAWLTHDIKWVIAGIVCRKPLDILLTFYFWKKQHIILRPQKNWQMIREIWKATLPIAGTAILQALSTEIFSIYINWVYGIDVLGRYRSIYDLLNKIWFIATLYPILIYPRLRSYFVDSANRSFFASFYFQLNKISIAGYAWLVICSALGYQLWLATTQTSVVYPFLFIAVLLGVFMSAHSRLGVELLQAADISRLGLAITVGSSLVTLTILLLGYKSNMHEVELAWIIGQFLACTFIDRYGLKQLAITQNIITFNSIWLAVILLLILPFFAWWPGVTLNFLFLIMLIKLLVKYIKNLRQQNLQYFN